MPARLTPLLGLIAAANLAVVAAAGLAPGLVMPVAVLAALTAITVLWLGRKRGERPAGEQGSPSADAPPTYELLERFAAGSMGEVWRARHKLLGREVAFKRIKPGSIDEEDTRRFEREARVLSKLESPHTVEVFDFGVTPKGDLYFAMELLDGIDLQKAVHYFGPFPPERVVHLLLQACASLAEAHGQGLVHRDIKPANFMICRYGGEFDFLKILDFGLVKKPPSKDSHVGVTQAATILGTPAYLAPESARGSKFVDGRVDLYALGAVAFWLLTGRLLFETERPMEMVQSHLTKPAPRASVHSPFEIPAALDILIDECLEKTPDARPKDARVLRRRLQEISLAKRWDEERAAEWWNKVSEDTRWR